MLLRILIGLLVSLAGLGMVWKTDIVIEALGANEWAERVIGGGGTRLFYKLLGTAVILIGFMVVTNLFGDFVVGLFGGLFSSL